jgi:RimJ/RimL family protein N-acetyltransferase
MKDNIASIRVMEKIGMRLVGEASFAAHPGVLYEIWNTE